MKTRVQWIHQNKPATRKQPRHQLSKRRRIGFAWRVRFPKRATHFAGISALKILNHCVYDVADALPEQNLTRSPPNIFFVNGQLENAGAHGACSKTYG